jgi:hypothetical protein
MAIYRDGSVYFTLDYGGDEETCRVSGIALLDIEGVVDTDLTGSEFVSMFEKHRARIHSIAISKIERNDRSYGGIFVMTSDLNDEASSADFTEAADYKGDQEVH